MIWEQNSSLSGNYWQDRANKQQGDTTLGLLTSSVGCQILDLFKMKSLERQFFSQTQLLSLQRMGKNCYHLDF